MDKSEILEKLKDQKEAGTKIIGIFPHQMIPEEIIHVSGAIPLKISFAGSEATCMKGMEYLTAATCPLARSIVGLFDEKFEIFSLIDAFVGGNYCNGDLCGSEYISEYFKVPILRVTIPWLTHPHARRMFQTTLVNFRDEIEKKLNVQISEDQLLNSISIYNQIREKLQPIARNNMGTTFQELLNELYLLGADHFLERLDTYNPNGHQKEPNLIEVAFTGSPVAIDDPILNLIEEIGLVIKYNDSESIFYFDKLIPEGDPMTKLADFYLEHHYSSRMYQTEVRTKVILDNLKSRDLKGIILHLLKFCDPYVATKRALKIALNEEGFSVLELERDYDQSTEQLKTRLEAFREMIE